MFFDENSDAILKGGVFMNSRGSLFCLGVCGLVFAACSDGSLGPKQGPYSPVTGWAPNQGNGQDARRYQGDPPALAQIQDKSVRAGESFSFSAMGSDPEGGALTYTFSTVGNVLPAQTSSNGLFAVKVPENISSGSASSSAANRTSSSVTNITAIVVVKDKEGQQAQVTFNIEVTSPGNFGSVVKKSCETFTVDWQRAACEAAGGFLGDSAR
jgi:hypothetical protein